MTPHVDELSRLGNDPEGGFSNGIALADEGDYRAIRVGSGVNIEEFGAVDGVDLGGDSIDYRLVTTFRDIGNTLDQLHDHSFVREDTIPRISLTKR
jgi:hypothetical protein